MGRKLPGLPGKLTSLWSKVRKISLRFNVLHIPADELEYQQICASVPWEYEKT